MKYCFIYDCIDYLLPWSIHSLINLLLKSCIHAFTNSRFHWPPFNYWIHKLTCSSTDSCIRQWIQAWSSWWANQLITYWNHWWIHCSIRDLSHTSTNLLIYRLVSYRPHSLIHSSIGSFVYHTSPLTRSAFHHFSIHSFTKLGIH